MPLPSSPRPLRRQLVIAAMVCFFARTEAASQTWISGGDAGQSWAVTAIGCSSGRCPYNNCGAYDLCTTSYAIDSTTGGGKGKCFDFNG